MTRSLTNAADMSGADSERNVVMMSFNWSCDVSKDGGGTWKRLDPTTIFPNTLAGGFCCDQVVIYVPHADLFVWFLQYNKDAAGQGAFRIAVASSSSVGSSPTNWTYWDFVAGDFGFPTLGHGLPGPGLLRRLPLRLDRRVLLGPGGHADLAQGPAGRAAR